MSAATVEPLASAAGPLASIARCVGCGRALRGSTTCPGCGRAFPVVDGLFEAIGPLRGTNRVAAAFYEGPSWSRFKRSEAFFLRLQGPGVRAARDQVLRHLPRLPRARVLEVGIGEGENLRFLPDGWEVFGVDVARRRLLDCLRSHPRSRGRLARAEGERLPFEDESFDAVFTVGGINYFRDPAAALREMRRVARPGAPLVAADENHDLHRLLLGHLLGLEALDRWTLGLSGLDPEFITMVFEAGPAVEAAARAVWPNHRRVPIWNRLGYCLIDSRER